MKHGECIVTKDEWTPKIGKYINTVGGYIYSEIYAEDLLSPIPLDFCTGIEFKTCHYDDIKEYITRSERPYLNLNIHSWRGVSPGAIHYYGSLRLEGLYISENNSEHNSSVCGFLGSHDLPKILELVDMKIPIRRLITQQEVDKYPDRFKSYVVGEMINAHYTKKAARELAKEIHE